MQSDMTYDEHARGPGTRRPRTVGLATGSAATLCQQQLAATILILDPVILSLSLLVAAYGCMWPARVGNNSAVLNEQ